MRRSVRRVAGYDTPICSYSCAPSISSCASGVTVCPFACASSSLSKPSAARVICPGTRSADNEHYVSKQQDDEEPHAGSRVLRGSFSGSIQKARRVGADCSAMLVAHQPPTPLATAILAWNAPARGSGRMAPWWKHDRCGQGGRHGSPASRAFQARPRWRAVMESPGMAPTSQLFERMFYSVCAVGCPATR